MESLKIVLMSVLAAVCYGILHDQVTARICVEYFTIGHPPVFNTTSPTLLALGWGIIATWWVGLPLGVMLALATQVGRLPKLSARQLLKPVAILLLCMGLCALVAGLIGWRLASAGQIPLPGGLPDGTQVGFMADWFAHSASYLSGFVGGVMVVCGVVFYRFKLARRGAAHVT